MPEYMLLLYTDEPDPGEQAKREGEMPQWFELNEILSEAGVFRASGRLHPKDSATTVRVRDGETDITDGPFATTKEILVGYYQLECESLDEALKYAAKVPLARYGSVEVRPIMPPPNREEQAQAAASQA